MKHTRGQWKSRSRDQCVYGPAGVTVAHCGDNGIYGDESYTISKEESYANARLIAAAPEMLYQLINIGLYGALAHDSDWIKIQPLIEKATGKTWNEIKETGE